MNAQIYATEIVKKLVRAGFTAYFAGGWVRDYLMGNPSDDIDIATNAPPDKILDLFPRTILVGLAFGIVIVVIDGHQFEVATFRRDINYEGGRRPTHIEYTTPEEDALRRDFTINGMFYDPLENVIHDYVHGKQDLTTGIIRAIGNPQERFFEDRLRMVRAVRFAARFGFLIDAETQDAVRENATLLFPAVAMERIWQEFNKMSKYPRFDQALIEMHRLGLLPIIFPALEKAHLNDIKKNVFSFSSYPENCPTILYLLSLFPDAPLKDMLGLCEFLRTSSQDSKWVELFFQAKSLCLSESTDLVAWAHFFANPNSQLCLDVLVANCPHEEKAAFLEKNREIKKTLQPHIDRIITKKPLISAAFLQKEGIPNSKIMGTLLKEAERIAILNNLNDSDSILLLLKETSIWPR